MKRIAIIVIGVTLIFGAAAAGTAYDYPTRPIQVVCPFPPGGPVDLAIRIVNDGMTEYLGQQVITVNKPGEPSLWRGRMSPVPNRTATLSLVFPQCY